MNRPDLNSFYWRCHYADARHVRFILFDPKGANCGMVTVLREDVGQFLGGHKAVDWNDWPDLRANVPAAAIST